MAVEELWQDNISSGINFSKYDKIEVKVQGENQPGPVADFTSSGLHTLLLQNILRAQYSVPTPVQKYGLPIIQAGRDMMACAQTGSGKTAAFLLPVIHRILETKPASGRGLSVQTPQAVIITPTRELAIQISEESRKFCSGSEVKTAVVYGGTDVRFQQAQLARGCNILVATPGRLLDFVERGPVSFQAVQYLVLDEADRMLDMGFMPDIRRCVTNPRMPRKGDRQTLMFSATFPEEIRRSAGEFLSNYLFLQVLFLAPSRVTLLFQVGLVGGACTDVSQAFFQCVKYEKNEKFIR